MTTNALHSSSLPEQDHTQLTICAQCQKRYVEPNDKYLQGSKKGQLHVKCKFCRKLCKAADFPTQLRLESFLDRNAQQDAPSTTAPSKTCQTNAASTWIAALDPEEESLLIHDNSLLRSLPAEALLADLPRAGKSIQWDQIRDRLRDIYSLDRLFTGNEAFQRYYTTETQTVVPICLLAVSLNNAATRSGTPFKFCWFNIPFKNKKATLFVSFGAWSSQEQNDWKSASPEKRVKECSAWESNIRRTSQAIGVPYDTIDSLTFNGDGTASSSHWCRDSLLWVSNATDVNNEHTVGELLFVSDKHTVSREQCTTSDDLLNILVNCFHRHRAKVIWHALQHEVLQAMHDYRDPGSVARAACLKLLTDKQY